MKKENIGIDFGTDHCTAAIGGKRKQKLLYSEGSTYVPALVGYTDLGRVYGKEAIEMYLNQPTKVINQAKRLIGVPYKDQFLSPFSNEMYTLTKREESEGYKINFPPGTLHTEITPEEVAAGLFTYMQDLQPEEPFINTTVIAVPAFYNDSQRLGIKNSVRLAGLQFTRCVDEPVALVVTMLNKGDPHREFFVFDMGAGKLECSIVSTEGTSAVLRASTGSLELGGREIDEAIFQYIRRKIMLKFRCDIKDEEITSFRLREDCKAAKELLSTQQSVKISVDVPKRDGHLDITLGRPDFEYICDEILEKVKGYIERCFKLAGMEFEDITHVLLAGGCSKIPSIRSMVQDITLCRCTSFIEDAHERIARGACMIPHMAGVFELTRTIVYMKIGQNPMSVLAKRGVQLPFRVELEEPTTKGHTEELVVTLFESDGSAPPGLISETIIGPLPPGKPGEVVVVVEVLITADHQMIVSASLKDGKQVGFGTRKVGISYDEYMAAEERIFILRDRESTMIGFDSAVAAYWRFVEACGKARVDYKLVAEMKRWYDRNTKKPVGMTADETLELVRRATERIDTKRMKYETTVAELDND